MNRGARAEANVIITAATLPDYVTVIHAHKRKGSGYRAVRMHWDPMAGKYVAIEQGTNTRKWFAEMEADSMALRTGLERRTNKLHDRNFST